MIYPDDFVNKIICGDCLEVMQQIPNNSIDLIYTDPPYPKKYLYLYEGMAKEAQRILKVGGSFISIIPHYALEKVMKDVSPYLKWRWIISMWQMGGQHPRMAMGVEVLWKPLGWWIKEKWINGRGFVVDGFINNPPDKKLDKWEQSEDWAEYALKFVFDEDAIVLDPLVGTGTLPVVMKRNNVNFIGIDVDQEKCKIARSRLNEMAR